MIPFSWNIITLPSLAIGITGPPVSAWFVFEAHRTCPHVLLCHVSLTIGLLLALAFLPHHRRAVPPDSFDAPANPAPACAKPRPPSALPRARPAPAHVPACACARAPFALCSRVARTPSDQLIIVSDSSLIQIADNARGSDKELERRRRIGLANRGRTPWNKGIKHNEETRELIKKRTIETLRDPKVRRKMSEARHCHSDQSRAKISLALRRIWHERLKQKRLEEKLHFSWAGYIAEAARLGGDDQRDLHWDSFQNIKADIAFTYLQQRAEKAKAQEAAKVTAEKAARTRAEKRAQEKDMKEERAKAKALARETLLERKKKNALARDLKVIERLTMIKHRMKLVKVPISNQREGATEPQPVVEKLNLELIKIEQMHRRVSLADQIQTIKNKKDVRLLCKLEEDSGESLISGE
ncbi:hypothetical protein AXF42_Ash010080 [Apostasia shenzhenica]|uniref:Nuclease associated modular domain-containing protein n=1 Tax=Apostasia shenzhenica TaxID=1088818 RepID=A0A2I0ACT4_9ASPA|nr:hypothetical protein AXF42_Ash010080 [Apostasia shenzhenica]